MGKDSSNPQEWLKYAKADLSSAKIILKESDNFHVVVYHSHQAIEKLLKRRIIISNRKLSFTHDLIQLLKDIGDNGLVDEYFEEFSFLMDHYINARYPQDEPITKQDARRCLRTARKIFKRLK